MPQRPPVIDAEEATRQFRARVFKPAEGVFLFHPRAMERLISTHLDAEGHSGTIPRLPYCILPRQSFMSGLESENPEALAVIEGLNLPEQVILLPTPPERRLDEPGFIRLLRDYWARRFEGEIARAWQIARETRRDEASFGPERLAALLGASACAEVEDVMTRDGLLPAGADPTRLCRGFVAFVTRLRYFSPGIRGFVFPGVRDWRQVDDWLAASGLDLPPPGQESGRLPALLERARPDPRCGQPARTPLIPSDLAYGRADPDLAPARPAPLVMAPNAQQKPPRPPATTDNAAQTAETDPLSGVESGCLALLCRDGRPARRGWRRRLRDAVLGLFAAPLFWLLTLPRRWARLRTPLVQGLRVRLALHLFDRAIRRARRAEERAQHAAAIIWLELAQRRFERIAAPSAPATDLVRTQSRRRRLEAAESLSTALALIWKLDPEGAAELGHLTARLSDELLDARRRRLARVLLSELQRVLHESRTTYYQLRPIAWLFTLGRVELRCLLPFQANLKALRILETIPQRLEQFGWSLSEVEDYSRPLLTLSGRLAGQLEQQLEPRLRQALDEAGFTPTNHHQQVAANKLLRELLDNIRRRRHLKFTDVRDVVARNQLRLPDVSPRDVFRGDRLARFDRAAARRLPGVYQPGEFYIKGLQQLSAPLFGTRPGRLTLRHLLLPFGVAFIILKSLDLVLALLPSLDIDYETANLWLIGAGGLLINAIVYSDQVRRVIWMLLQAVWTGLRLALVEGPRRLLRWQPVSRLLNTSLVRGLDRQLLRPFLIGAMLVIPSLGIASLIEGELVLPDPTVLALTLALGLLIRNTPAGRRWLDELTSAAAQFLRRVNETLVIGLVKELLHLFKEVTRRFEQGLHWIEEMLSHHLGESRLELAAKALLLPVWRLLEAVMQFYVTVLVEPQINPIKHFPLVTIGHKLMLPFFPIITSFMVGVLDPVLPKWISYPFITITILLLPGLAGFLVWELKENWNLYAANHGPRHTPDPTGPAESLGEDQEPAVVGHHGETIRGLLHRGFHSGTLPKAFDRLRAVLYAEIRDDTDYPWRLRDAKRHLAEVERVIAAFCERDLVYALDRRRADPASPLSGIRTRRPRLATNAFEIELELHQVTPATNSQPFELAIRLGYLEPDLALEVRARGPAPDLECAQLIRADLLTFGHRAGANRVSLEL